MQLRQLLKAKIHHARVTYANPDYVGSLEVDLDLLDKVGIVPGELIHIWNTRNGARIETYALAGKRGSGVCGLNGAAAFHGSVGDKLIVASFVLSDETVEPTMVLVDEQNRFIKYLDLNTTKI